MPWNRATLEETNERVENKFKGLLGLTLILRRSFIAVISRVLSGIAHLWHGHLEYNTRQLLPTTMDEENLIPYGGVWQIPRLEAVAGIFSVEVTGVDGTTIPQNTIFKRSDNFEYFTESAGVISSGSATINIVAEEAGIDGGLSVGDKVSLLNPVASIDSEATVLGTSIEPENIEDLEVYRDRILERIRRPISGGSNTDYIQWAKEVAGVTRSWVLPKHLGEGTVGVTFVTDATDPITPSAAKVNEVDDYIQERKPVTANVTVFAPILFPIDMDISIRPNTTEVQNAVIEEIKDLILRDGNLAGSYSGPGETYDGKILISRINEAVSIGVGEEDHLINSINSAAPANIIPPTNHLVVLGNITWQNLA